MPNPRKAHDDLKKCMKTARTAAEKAACQAAFEGEGGTVDGGKVFSTPDGEATFVANGGKVFHGGKVF